jgi:Domain of unknown function (DUF4124)
MPEVRALLLALCFAAPAHADLYRWVDPESGSVKFSTLPPADAQLNAAIVPYRGPAPAPKPPPAAAAPGGAASSPSTPRSAFARSGDALREQAQSYDALRREQQAK